MDPRFSQEIADGYFRDPNSGEIIEADSGIVFDSNYEMIGGESGFEEGGGGGGDATGQAGAGAGSLLSAYMMSQMLPGSAPAATAATGTGAATGAGAGAAAATAAAAPGATAGGATTFASAAAAEAAGYTAVGTAAEGGVLAVPATGMAISPAALWAGPIAATAWGAKSGYDTYKDADDDGAWKGFKKNNNDLLDLAKIVGTGGYSLYGDAAAAIAGSMFGSGKDKDQQNRDSDRKGMRNAGFFGDPEDTPDGWMKKLSSGAELDFGMDGGARLSNLGSNIDGKSDRAYYDADFSRGDTGDLAALLDPLGQIYGSRSAKGGTDMTGYLVNLAQQKGDAWSNAEELYGDLDYNTARDLINQAKIDQGRKDAMYNTLDDVYGVNAYAGKGTAWERKGLTNKGPNAYQPKEEKSEERSDDDSSEERSGQSTPAAVTPVTKPTTPPRQIFGSAVPGRPSPEAPAPAQPLKPQGQSMFVRRPDPKKTSTQQQMNRLYRKVA